MDRYSGRFWRMTTINRWAEEDISDWKNNMEKASEQENYSSYKGIEQDWDDDPRHVYVDDSDDSDDFDDEDLEWDDFDDSDDYEEYDDDEDWDDEDDLDDEDEDEDEAEDEDY